MVWYEARDGSDRKCRQAEAVTRVQLPACLPNHSALTRAKLLLLPPSTDSSSMLPPYTFDPPPNRPAMELTPTPMCAEGASMGAKRGYSPHATSDSQSACVHRDRRFKGEKERCAKAAGHGGGGCQDELSDRITKKQNRASFTPSVYTCRADHIWAERE